MKGLIWLMAKASDGLSTAADMPEQQIFREI